jgi:hypothetical protein
MKQLQVLASEYGTYDGIKYWQDCGIDVIVVDDWKTVDNTITVLCYSDLQKSHVRYWLNNKQPAIYSGRGYAGNHLYKHRLFHRASVNGWANTKLNPVPHSRWDFMNLPRHHWKVKKVKNVLIAPSKSTAKIWTPELDWRWAESMIEKFPGADVKIRAKPGKAGLRYETLWQDFDWADLVVSQSSAITVEAFWYGKKVISTEPCITWAAGPQELDDWQNPKEPELREAWHEHLAWSQFTNDEWKFGKSFELLEQYLGPINLYQSEQIYNFRV